MNKKEFSTFSEFWPFYVNEHSQKDTRNLHFIGNTNLFFWLLMALFRRSIPLFFFAVASSYLIAWIGHFFVEENMPATFKYPVYSAIGDMVMYLKMWNGTMEAEVAKYTTNHGVNL